MHQPSPPAGALPGQTLTTDTPMQNCTLDSVPHRLERDVQQALLSDPQLRFPSLVVHRIPNGVCLQGVVETLDDECDVCQLAREVAGVNEVLNRLVVRRQQPPPKG